MLALKQLHSKSFRIPLRDMHANLHGPSNEILGLFSNIDFAKGFVIRLTRPLPL